MKFLTLLLTLAISLNGFAVGPKSPRKSGPGRAGSPSSGLDLKPFVETATQHLGRPFRFEEFRGNTASKNLLAQRYEALREALRDSRSLTPEKKQKIATLVETMIGDSVLARNNLAELIEASKGRDDADLMTQANNLLELMDNMPVVIKAYVTDGKIQVSQEKMLQLMDLFNNHDFSSLDGIKDLYAKVEGLFNGEFNVLDAARCK